MYIQHLLLAFEYLFSRQYFMYLYIVPTLALTLALIAYVCGFRVKE